MEKDFTTILSTESGLPYTIEVGPILSGITPRSRCRILVDGVPISFSANSLKAWGKVSKNLNSLLEWVTLNYPILMKLFGGLYSIEEFKNNIRRVG